MLNKILPLCASLLRHKDRITICNSIYNALISLLSGDDDCVTLLTTVKEQNTNLKLAHYQVKKASVFTPRLRNIVSERTDVIAYIYKFLKAQSFYFLDVKVQKAAQTLLIELKHAVSAHKIKTHSGGSIASEEIIKICAKKKNK